MKKIIVFALLLTVSVASFSQPTITPTPDVETDYLKKSRGQKVAAWILLGTGAGIFAIIAPGNVSLDALGTLAVVGTLATLSSIPLFIAGAKNKRKARNATASFKMERLPVIQNPVILPRSYPALAVKISL